MLNTRNSDLLKIAPLAAAMPSKDLFQDMSLYLQDDAYDDVYDLFWEVSFQSPDLN